MVTDLSRIRRFCSFLHQLKDEHCDIGLESKCRGAIVNCTVKRALSTAGYDDMLWCPRCDGHQTGVVQIETKKGKKQVARYDAGWIIGVLPDSGYRALYACNCETGKEAWRRIRTYDFREDAGVCFQKRQLALIESRSKPTEPILAETIPLLGKTDAFKDAETLIGKAGLI